MIYLSLFLTFLKIGTFSFGGGYGMISVIRDECLSIGWLNEEQLMNFIAVAESTPGPIAINMATFVGSSQGGLLGAIVATAGVVFPSFIIILLISAVLKNLLKFAGVRAGLDGVRPVVVGLIIATGFTMLLNVILGVSAITDEVVFDYKALIIFLGVTAIYLLYYFIRKKNFSPILLIVISGIAGVILYSF